MFWDKGRDWQKFRHELHKGLRDIMDEIEGMDINIKIKGEDVEELKKEIDGLLKELRLKDRGKVNIEIDYEEAENH